MARHFSRVLLLRCGASAVAVAHTDRLEGGEGERGEDWVGTIATAATATVAFIFSSLFTGQGSTPMSWWLQAKSQ